MSAPTAESSPRQRGPDFVVCGHAVQDLLDISEDTGWRLGGAVAYASLLAHRLGFRTGVLTSTSPEMQVETLLPGIEVINTPSSHSTQMRNVYSDGGRRQEMPQRAATIGAELLPEAWKRATMVLLGPVAGELEDSLAASFPDSIVGVGAQGWLRETGPDSRVRPRMPEAWHAEPVLGHARVLFVSDEDLPESSAPAALARWSSMVETVAFTRGDRGADVCHRGAWRHIDAFPATPLDRTGAGDVFAAALLIGLHETGEVWKATRFANCAGSFVVEGEGVAAVPDRAMIEARLKAHPEVIAK